MLLTAAKRARAPLGSGAWLSALVRYSGPAMSASNDRARRARTLPWGDVWGAGDAFNRKWQALREFVTDALEHPERQRDPCPAAVHFGSVADGSRGRMVRAACAGDMRNRFWRVAR